MQGYLLLPLFFRNDLLLPLENRDFNLSAASSHVVSPPVPTLVLAVLVSGIHILLSLYGV
jgi:hypothetical protein